MGNTTREYKEAQKIIDKMFTLKTWVNKNFQTALKTLKEIMEDEGANPSVRVNVAKDIIKLHAFFFDKQGGKVDVPAYKEKPEKEDEKPTGPVLFNTKFTGTDG